MNSDAKDIPDLSIDFLKFFPVKFFPCQTPQNMHIINHIAQNNDLLCT